MTDSFLFQAFVYLLAAVIAVPIAKRLGLGSVLGYLLAGVAIGPFGLNYAATEFFGHGIGQPKHHEPCAQYQHPHITRIPSGPACGGAGRA